MNDCGKFTVVVCPVSVRVVPVTGCNWHALHFLNMDHIFSSSLITLFFYLLPLWTGRCYLIGVAKHSVCACFNICRTRNPVDRL